MKISLFFSGLLVTPLPFSASCEPFSPTFFTAQAQNIQAALPTTSEKISRIPWWQFDDLALLKAIKNNATRLSN
jgi:hypothetical protein